MKEINLITVGSLKDKNIQSLEDHYLKQIKGFKLKIHEVKSKKEDLELEADEILKKINQISVSNNPQIILLTETGKEMDSLKFSNWLFSHLESSIKDIILIIGGASGFSKRIKEASGEQISLSKLTFPHKFARLLLIEQIYRAQTIKQGHPYHK